MRWRLYKKSFDNPAMNHEGFSVSTAETFDFRDSDVRGGLVTYDGIPQALESCWDAVI
jgi:hypothetical protein